MIKSRTVSVINNYCGQQAINVIYSFVILRSNTFLIIASLSAGEPKMLRDASIPSSSYYKIREKKGK